MTTSLINGQDIYLHGMKTKRLKTNEISEFWGDGKNLNFKFGSEWSTRL